MSPELKRFLEKLGYANKYLTLYAKFGDPSTNCENVNKKDLLRIFTELGRTVTYLTGGSYIVNREFDDYSFGCNFVITSTQRSVYYLISRNGVGSKDSGNIGGYLRDIRYDENLILDNYYIDTLTKMKEFIADMLDLFDLFANGYPTYMKEAERHPPAAGTVG